MVEMNEQETQLQTEISAKFVYMHSDDPNVINTRQILQRHLDNVTKRLHQTFRMLIIEMLDAETTESKLTRESPTPEVESNQKEETDA